MSKFNVLRANASLYRALLTHKKIAKRFFSALSTETSRGTLQKRSLASLAGPVRDNNILSSPFGDVEEVNENLTEYVFKGCEDYGNLPAITCGSTGRSYSYAMCRMMMQRFSRALLSKLKLKPGDTVGLILPNIPEFVVVIFGAMEAGLKVTCANPLYTPDELTRQFSNCDVNLIITIDMFMSKVDVIKKSLPNYKSTVLISDSGKSENDIFDLKTLLINDYDADLPKIDVDSIALIPYSSGTTGLPKGVLLTHKNLVTNLKQFGHEIFRQYPERERNRSTILTVPPFFHIYGFNGILNYNLGFAKHVVTIPRFTPEDYIKCLAEYRPKTLFVVPSLLTFLANHPNVTKDHLSSIQDVTIGAAPVSESVLEKFLLKCGKTREQITLQQGFGMSESSPVTLLTPYIFPASKATSAGQIVPGTECRVVSITTGENVGPHKTGELLCRGPQVMQGYLRNETATKETIDEEGWLHTGDVAYYDEDHFFYIVDRTKELIKVKGNQVSPTELENLILEIPSVADAAVVGMPDHLAGELPKAFVVMKQGKELPEKEIYDWIAEKVVKYKRLDGGIAFIDSIPRNPGGKIMRNELKVLGGTMSKSKN